MNLDILYPYQLNNAKFLANLGFGMEGSFVGSGKSLILMGVFELLDTDNVLLIVPKAVFVQWGKNFKQFMPEFTVFQPQSSKAKDRVDTYNQFLNSNAPKKVLIITYEWLRIDQRHLCNQTWGVIACDEIHRAGNSMTKLYKALRQLDSPYRYGLSATPMRSNPS